MSEKSNEEKILNSIPSKKELRKKIADFLEKTDMSPRKFGLLSIDNHKIVNHLEKGGDIYLGTATKIITFIEKYKPEEEKHI